MKVNINALFFLRTLENIAIVVCSTFAALKFEKPVLLCWFIVALFNHYSFESKGSDTNQ